MRVLRLSTKVVLLSFKMLCEDDFLIEISLENIISTCLVYVELKLNLDSSSMVFKMSILFLEVLNQEVFSLK